MIWDYIGVYGVLIACVIVIVTLAAVVTGCVIRMRQLETRVNEMEKVLSKRMEEAAQDARDDSRRQRRLLNESMANLSESMTRAILTMNEQERKKTEKQ